ncbi:glycosyltransferase [Leifsonia sp. F6_8S_P_1B]|uniref:4,4'-diaponeurosporenoate glycosyltransferase n=1 Tax=Leifsonia williamsii TaxID=3035919 RepID=A0ABT8KAZ3_9MICO|nr:glycosyltransferase [Leifsonia williamsii]MDN4614615.1 glycosyltransferase [Leifsonia williamsii]
MTARPPIQRVVVAVPARDEAATLDACLTSLERACAAVPLVRTSLVLLLDACTDDSAEIAARHPLVRTIERSYESVGRSRAAAIEAALASAPEADDAVWIAMTDGDGVVPRRWLREHLRAAATADAYVGAVVPRLDDLDDPRRRVWHARHSPGAALGHVHGANLGVRAGAYRMVGGMEPLATGEDVALVDRLRAAGVAIAASEEQPVITSARLSGRAPDGYAAYLTALAP